MLAAPCFRSPASALLPPSPVSSPSRRPKSSPRKLTCLLRSRSYTLGVVAYAIHAVQYTPSSYASTTDEALARQVAGKRIEPVARFLRRVAGALVTVAVAELAGSVSLISKGGPLRVSRAAVYVFSAAASALGLAACVLAEQLVDTADWNLPRLDDQFNTTTPISTLIAVALVLLLVGALLAFLAAAKATAAAIKAHVLSQVRPTLHAHLYFNAIALPLTRNLACSTLLTARSPAPLSSLQRASCWQ